MRGGYTSRERIDRLRQGHAEPYRRQPCRVRPLPGARELLSFLTDVGIRWAIATSGRMETAAINLASLGVDPEQTPVVTRDQVKYAKPDPDLFLAAAARLNAPIETAVVVGDSIWGMLAATRCRMRLSAEAFVLSVRNAGSAPNGCRRTPPRVPLSDRQPEDSADCAR